MNTTAINPFLNRNKVTDPREFFGRTREIGYIIEKLTYHEPQSVAVIGERRSGKSSLLTKLYQALSRKEYKRWCTLLSEDERNRWEKIHSRLDNYNKFVCILLDFEEITASSTAKFSWVIIDELISEDTRLANYLQYYPPVKESDRKIVPQRHPQIVLKNLLKEACAQGYRFVFLIDEFELLARNEALKESRYLHYLRGISDNYALAFITSSRKPLSEITPDTDPHGSPFDNNFSQPVHLGLLAEDEPVEMIRGVLKSYKCEPTKLQSFEGRIIELAGRHPYFLKIACAHLLDWIDEGKPDHICWEDEFKTEASEEFDRMWEALTKKEHDWIFSVRKSNDTMERDTKVFEELQFLLERGVLKSDGDGVLTLFSEGFADYIREYVKALENRYERIEKDISEDYKRLDSYDHLKEVCSDLEKLRDEWQEQKQEGRTASFEKTFTKCDHLLKILRRFLDIQEVINSCQTEQGMLVASAEVNSRVEKALRAISDYFEKPGWFEEENEGAISIYSGKSILDHLVRYLQRLEKHHIFGNGYDRILAVRVNFMKKHGSKKFRNFYGEVRGTFERLIAVYDYSRATVILQLRFNLAFRKLSEKFFEYPIKTIGVIILFPLFLASGLNSFEINGIVEDVVIPIWLLVFYGYFSWVTYRPLFSEKYCELPKSKNLYKKLFFRTTYFWSFAVFAALMGTVLKMPGVDKALAQQSHKFLLAGFCLGVVAWLLIAAAIKSKVLNFKTAVRRSSFFCCSEYFKAFCFILALYVISAHVINYIPELKETVRNLAEDQKGKEQWYLLSEIHFGQIWLNLRVLLGLCFVAPLAGAWKFIQEMVF